MDKSKRSLNAYKGHLTRSFTNSETLIKRTIVDLVEVQATIKSLETRWTNYEQAYNVVESLMLESDDTDQEIDELQNEYYKYQDQYQELITKLRTTASTLIAQNNSGQVMQPTPNSNMTSTRPKLPSIQLPTFSGDLGEYESFIDQFEAQIGGRTDLEPVTKLQYLKTQLKRQALDLIKGFSSISDNYQSALDTLKESYGDEEKIKHCLLQKIVNLEPPKHTRSDLESFRVSLLNLTRSLRNKHDFSCCEWIVASLFQHKLPNATNRQLYLKYERNFFSLEQLNEGLRDLISHMEIERQQKHVKGSKIEAQYDASEPLTDKRIGTYFSTDTQTKTDTRPSKAIRESNCRFCGATHKDSQCTRYSSGADRIKRLKELKLCSRCMGRHQTKSCLVILQTCRKCHRGKHHTLLCKTYDQPMTYYNAKTSNNDTPENLPANNIGHINVSLNASENQASRSALATARAMLEESGEEIRLFFDQGSQKTFITKGLVERTGMAIKSTQNMTLQGFMSKPNSNVYQIVRPKIRMGK